MPLFLSVRKNQKNFKDLTISCTRSTMCVPEVMVDPSSRPHCFQCPPKNVQMPIRKTKKMVSVNNFEFLTIQIE